MLILGARKRIAIDLGDGREFTLIARGVGATAALSWQSAVAEAGDDPECALDASLMVLEHAVCDWDGVQDAAGVVVEFDSTLFDSFGLGDVITMAAEVVTGGSRRLGNG